MVNLLIFRQDELPPRGAPCCPRHTDPSTIRHILNLSVFRWAQATLTWEPALRPAVWACPRACTSQPTTFLLKLIKQIKQSSISATKANAASESRKYQQLFLRLKWAPPYKLDLNTSGIPEPEVHWTRVTGNGDSRGWMQVFLEPDYFIHHHDVPIPHISHAQGVHRPRAACRTGTFTTGPGQFSDLSFGKPGTQCFLIQYFYILHWPPHPKPPGL